MHSFISFILRWPVALIVSTDMIRLWQRRWFNERTPDIEDVADETIIMFKLNIHNVDPEYQELINEIKKVQIKPGKL